MKKFIFSLILASILVSFFIWTLFPITHRVKFFKKFYIKRGEGVFEIAINLEKENLIKNKFSFILYLLLKGKMREIKAGYYLLSPSFSIPEIAEKLTKGKTIEEKITIIEGWSKKDIANYLKEKGICSQSEFFKTIKFEKWREKYDFFQEDIAPRDVEGHLFPDTYFFEHWMSSTAVEDTGLRRAEKIVQKMLDNFDKKLSLKMRKEIERQDKKVFEIITMASLVEKEVKTLEEKKLVSGILWKRLKNEIPLQVDATIIFITGKKTIKVSKKDTEIDSPYNTYKYKGLPPSPICNPGLESIKAVIYPKTSDFWYYLSIPGRGTIFNKTLREHNRAKARYF